MLRTLYVPLIFVGGMVGCAPQAATTPAAPTPVAAPFAATPVAPAASIPSVAPPKTATNLPSKIWDADERIPAWAGQQAAEPFNVKQFLESRAAPADNAAPLYFAAMAELGGEMYVGPAVPASWPWRQPPPPLVTALATDIGRLADLKKLRSGEIPPAEVARVLAAAEPTMQKLDLAQQKPICVFISGTNIDSLLPYAQTARAFARLAQIQLHSARLTGNLDLAEQTVRRTLRLSRDLRPRGPLVCQLVANAIDGVVYSTIHEITLGDVKLDAKGCERLLSTLEEHERAMLSSRSEGLRMEYISVRNTFDELQSGKRTYEDMLKFFGQGGQPLPSGALERLQQIKLPVEIAAVNRAFGSFLSAAELPLDQALTAKPWDSAVETLKAEQARLTLQMLPTMGEIFRADAIQQTRRAGVKSLIAIKRYYAAHNGPPADLATACREAGLAAVPIDSFDGQPMRFKMVGQAPIVYSVGTDLKDDGGAVDSEGQLKPGDWLFTFKN